MTPTVPEQQAPGQAPAAPPPAAQGPTQADLLAAIMRTALGPGLDGAPEEGWQDRVARLVALADDPAALAEAAGAPASGDTPPAAPAPPP